MPRRVPLDLGRLDGELHQPEGKIHPLAPFYLEREALAELDGLHRPAVRVERGRLVGLAPQAVDGVLEATGVPGGQPHERRSLQIGQTDRESLGGGIAGPQEKSSDLLAPGRIRIEQVGEGHLLGEAGATTSHLERIEKGRVAARERRRQVRKDLVPEVLALVAEREIGRSDVVRGVHPTPWPYGEAASRRLRTLYRRPEKYTLVSGRRRRR